MNFPVLPPQIKFVADVRLCGMGPMLAAATAWDGFVAELRSAATSRLVQWLTAFTRRVQPMFAVEELSRSAS